MSKNLPLGAENDPRAPWNEEELKLEDVQLDITLTISSIITLQIPEGSTNKDINMELKSFIGDDFNGNDWKINDIDWKKL